MALRFKRPRAAQGLDLMTTVADVVSLLAMPAPVSGIYLAFIESCCKSGAPADVIAHAVQIRLSIDELIKLAGPQSMSAEDWKPWFARVAKGDDVERLASEIKLLSGPNPTAHSAKPTLDSSVSQLWRRVLAVLVYFKLGRFNPSASEMSDVIALATGRMPPKQIAEKVGKARTAMPARKSSGLIN